MRTQAISTSAMPWLLAALFAATGVVGNAQQSSALPEVRVEAKRSVTIVGKSYSGAPIEQVQVMRRVSYSDLDLSTTAGATELERRISAAATEECKELDKAYPLEDAGGQACVKQATNAAMPQVKSAIAVAEAKNPTGSKVP